MSLEEASRMTSFLVYKNKIKSDPIYMEIVWEIPFPIQFGLVNGSSLEGSRTLYV